MCPVRAGAATADNRSMIRRTWWTSLTMTQVGPACTPASRISGVTAVGIESRRATGHVGGAHPRPSTHLRRRERTGASERARRMISRETTRHDRPVPLGGGRDARSRRRADKRSRLRINDRFFPFGRELRAVLRPRLSPRKILVLSGRSKRKGNVE